MRLERIACRRGFKETEYACGDFFVESESERTYTALELDETISIVRECAQQACLIFYVAGIKTRVKSSLVVKMEPTRAEGVYLAFSRYNIF